MRYTPSVDSNSDHLRVAARDKQRFAIILAGGDGTRLRPLTRRITGDERPKQFVSILGNTLLEITRRRVESKVLPENILYVVTQQHNEFYVPILSDIDGDYVVEQPCNLGTAPAIIYSLVKLALIDPRAAVALFPSDHYFSNDSRFMSAVESAYEAVGVIPDTVVLLGIKPDSAETSYGWIETETSILSSMPGAITRVARFWEKPSTDVARSLMSRGCLWNSFVMVGHVDAFLKLIDAAIPEVFEQFANARWTLSTQREPEEMRAVYSRLSSTNFSSDVLERCPERLAVLPVENVGWSDLGEPARVLSTLESIGVVVERAA
jgi:mannose-1-phosphate guanylyltransferase